MFTGIVEGTGTVAALGFVPMMLSTGIGARCNARWPPSSSSAWPAIPC